MTNKIWVLGDAVIDLLPESHNHLLKCPGGAPANVAVGIARLGGDSHFIGRVGDDPFGSFLQQTLRHEGVGTACMRTDPDHRTSTVVVSLDDHGERSFTFMVRPGADLFLEPDDLPSFSEGEWLHACSIALSAEPCRTTTLTAMKRIKQAGGWVSFDPNIRADLWQDDELLHQCLDQALHLADVVKLSMEELTFIAGTQPPEHAIEHLAKQYGLTLLVVTQGKEGVLVHWQGATRHYSATPVKSVDTTGAGDAFVAGLLWGLARFTSPHAPEEIAGIIQLAQQCGALATTAKGAMTALPRRHDLALPVAR